MHPAALARVREVLAGGTAGQPVDRLNVAPVNGRDVTVVRHAGEPLVEDAAGVFVDLAVPGDLTGVQREQAEFETAVAGAEGADANHAGTP